MKFPACIICSVVLLFAGISHAPALQKPGSGTVRIIIEPVFNGHPLILNSQTYRTPTGDSLSINLFRFYISRLSLRSSTSVFSDSTSHLIDAEDKSTCSLLLSGIPAGTYTSLHFIVGVDSVANTNGANSGDLDPAKGMYWAWNSGYIMAKLEGHSPACKTIHSAFEFHIGGYAAPYNTARSVTLSLPHPVSVRDDTTTITVRADVAAWFLSGPGLAMRNSVLIPGKEAAAMADNYAKMFSVE